MARKPSDTAAPGQADVLLVDFGGGTDGHRGQYNAMLAALFTLRPAPFGPGVLRARQPVLVPQIEHAPALFLLTCLVRSLTGRRSVGLLLRPLPALEGKTLRLRLKRAMLRLLRRLPQSQVLTIIPFDVEPRFGTIASGWIHDLQNWDFALGSTVDPGESARVAQTLRAAAGDRRLVCALGGQSREKGFDRFAALWSRSGAVRDRYLFAFGGKVAPDLGEAAEQFAAAGGLAMNRFVSDPELFGHYAAADLVWCAYDPSYDQASGVLGRAMQAGVPVVVRAGSIVERLCHLAGHPCIVLSDADDGGLPADPPPRLARNAAQERACQQGRESLARLASALGVEPAYDPFAGAPTDPVGIAPGVAA